MLYLAIILKNFAKAPLLKLNSRAVLSPLLYGILPESGESGNDEFGCCRTWVLGDENSLNFGPSEGVEECRV